MQIRRWILFTVLALACLGAVVSGRLTIDHYQFLGGHRHGDSFCNVSEFVNCDAVTVSDYAEKFGFATSSFGVAAYLFVLLIGFAILSRFNHSRVRFPASLLWWATSAMFLFSLYQIYISLFVIRALCIFCFAAHAITLLLWICAWVACRGHLTYTWRLPWSALKNTIMVNDEFGEPRSGLLKWITIAAVCFAVVLGWDGWVRKNYLKVDQDQLKQFASFMQKQRPVLVNLGQSPRVGPAEAPVQIVEFSDFGCPFCRRAAFVTRAVLHQQSNDVELIFKHFPLDKACNVRMQSSTHPFACELAKGSICAQDQNKFWAYHDATFAHEKKFDENTATAIANSVGLRIEEFSACMKSVRTRQRLRADIEAAYRAGVESTPSFFFNGRKVAGLLTVHVMQHLTQVAKTLEKP